MRIEELPTKIYPWHPLADDSPWRPATASPTGRLVYHYAASFARLPCRDVTKLADERGPDGVLRADNKSDPNLETMTFGMWSTCDQSYRHTMAAETGRTLIFRTRWPTDNDSVLTGFYDIGWYLDSWYVAAPGKKRPARVVPDRFLAAERAHFVAKPIPVVEAAALIGYEPEELERRSVIEFSEKDTASLRKLLLEQEDASQDYLEEIRRLEYCNLASTERRYVNWDRVNGFDWQAAKICVALAARKPPSEEMQTAWKSGVKKGKWVCLSCEKTIDTPRAIKICSSAKCMDGGYFVPVADR